jgi:apolipoprotein D and lipocalin family protein
MKKMIAGRALTRKACKNDNQRLFRIGKLFRKFYYSEVFIVNLQIITSLNTSLKMKQLIKPLFILLFIIPVFNSCTMAQSTLPVVSNVDIQRYAGKWFEIASFPMKFQKNCFCVTADYTLMEKGYVKVYNSCRKGSVNGKVKSINGKAFVVEGANNAKLKVQFFWPFKADYWIIDLDPDYQWAVVSGPSREYLWILSRTPVLPDSTYKGITERLKNNGFDLTKLQLMVHKQERS